MPSKNALTSSASPLACNSTRPSAGLGTHPVTLNPFAICLTESRKPTPWTRPSVQTCTAFIVKCRLLHTNGIIFPAIGRGRCPQIGGRTARGAHRQQRKYSPEDTTRYLHGEVSKAYPIPR